jgi:hypothetical protein
MVQTIEPGDGASARIGHRVNTRVTRSNSGFYEMPRE